jgi:hypothetical protein
MAEYYRNRPSVVAAIPRDVATRNGDEGDAIRALSDFDKHRKTLLSQEIEEGWASELRRYLGGMQDDITKDTDIIDWWQVSNSYVW